MHVFRAIQHADEQLCQEYTCTLEPRKKVRGGIEWQAVVYRGGEQVDQSEYGTIDQACLASMALLSAINLRLLSEAEERLNQENPEHVYPEPSDTFCDGVES